MNPIEWKTKMQSLAVFLIATAGLSWLATESTDFIATLPDWLEAPAYALALALTGLLTGYVTKHRPQAMSDSAREAVRH
jgi:ABC-type transporter Mla maintaining outer membrane lipid asymmetry permease subunit MlaE